MNKTKLKFIKIGDSRKRRWVLVKNGRIALVYSTFFHALIGCASPSLTSWFAGNKV